MSKWLNATCHNSPSPKVSERNHPSDMIYEFLMPIRRDWQYIKGCKFKMQICIIYQLVDLCFSIVMLKISRNNTFSIDQLTLLQELLENLEGMFLLYL